MRLSLPIYLLIAGLSTNVIAQKSSSVVGGDNNLPQLSSATSANSASATQNTQSITAAPASSTGGNTGASKTSGVLITGSASGGGGDDAPSLSTSSVIVISGTPVTTAVGGGGALPSLPQYPSAGIPNYPAPTVPDTRNAPYMQRSNLPEGTVFIAVGACLGLFGLIAVLWRTIVAWQLRRSIRRANQAANMTDVKSGLLGRYDASSSSKKPFYSAGPGSSVSLDHLGGSRTGQTPNSSLFFSPTANGPNPAQNRASAYLPAGYYAPATPGSATFNNSRDSLPRRPATRDGTPLFATPPGSPLLTPVPRRSANNSPGHRHATSGSSRVSLGATPQGRTPSTYLEDMLDIPLPADMDAENRRQSTRSDRRKSGNNGQYGGYSRAGRS